MKNRFTYRFRYCRVHPVSQNSRFITTMCLKKVNPFLVIYCDFWQEHTQENLQQTQIDSSPHFVHMYLLYLVNFSNDLYGIQLGL